MPEFEHSLPASDDPEWVGLVLGVENRFEALNDALADLRSAVIRLSSYRPQPQVIHQYVAEPEHASEAAAALEDAVRAFEAAAAVEETPVVEPALEAITSESKESNGASPLTEETPAPADDDAARREEVGRIVAEAREKQHASPAPAFDGSWAEPHDDSEVDSTSEGSWPMARSAGVPLHAPEPHKPVASNPAPAMSAEEAVAEAAPAIDAAEQARREEVARMVAEMRAAWQAWNAELSTPRTSRRTEVTTINGDSIRWHI